VRGRVAGSSEAQTGRGEHVAVFYAHDRELIETVGQFLLDGLQDGVAIAMATRGHRRALDAWLECAGVDVPGSIRARRYIEVDAADTLARVMVEGWPDPAGFWQAIMPLMDEAASSGRPVRIFGELVSLLWESGQVGAAIDVEALWNELGAQHPFDLICGNAAESASVAEHSDSFAMLCSAHTRTVAEQ